MHQISEKKKEKKPNASASSLCRSIFADYLFSVVAFGTTGAAGFAAAGAAGVRRSCRRFLHLVQLIARSAAVAHGDRLLRALRRTQATARACAENLVRLLERAFDGVELALSAHMVQPTHLLGSI